MLTGGFFNSIDGDTRYNARQMGQLFDGIITDGVFNTVGDAFSVTAKGDGYVIQIGTGRAWYNHTWVYNDDIYEIVLDVPSAGYNRYDLVCIFINDNERTVSFSIVSGNETTGNAVIPNVPDDRYHAIARINVRNDRMTKSVIAGDITYGIANAVTGLLQQLTLPAIQAKFESLYNQRENQRDTKYQTAENTRESKFTTNENSRISTFNTNENNRISTFNTLKTQIEEWYNAAKTNPVVPVIKAGAAIPKYEGSIWIEE